MNYDEILDTFEKNMARKINSIPQRLRLFTTEFAESNNISNDMIVTGLRGVGKSTFLLYHIKQSGKKILYFSADNPLIAVEDIYMFVSKVFMKGYDGVAIDEVHYAKDWSKNLKALYDDFPDRIVWASDSSSLILRKGLADLSRRFVFLNMPLMSFREFIYLETGKIFNKIDPFNLSNTSICANPDAELMSLFENYKKFGTRPFYQNGNFEERSLAVLDKVIHSDITYFLPTITENNLRIMNAVIGLLSQAAIPRIQLRSLCKDWSVSAEKVYQLLYVMDSVGLISIARYPNDMKAMSVGAKILFADPNLYYVLKGNQGTQREAFVMACLREMKLPVYASKDETSGDFIVENSGKRLTIEVGGKNKVFKHSDFVVRDNTDYPSANVIPLWLLAMGW